MLQMLFNGNKRNKNEHAEGTQHKTLDQNTKTLNQDGYGSKNS